MTAISDDLKVVDGQFLAEPIRTVLRPGEVVADRHGRMHRLPRYFYEIQSEEHARTARLTDHFSLNEFLLVDFKEALVARQYPRYVPCAVRFLAFFMEGIRQEVGTAVAFAVNGGYRTPSHRLSVMATPHMWGTAADIFRVGSVELNTRKSIERFRAIAESVSDALWVMPYGQGTGFAGDHAHVDLGYTVAVPREISEAEQRASVVQAPVAIERRRRSERRLPVDGELTDTWLAPGRPGERRGPEASRKP